MSATTASIQEKEDLLNTQINEIENKEALSLTRGRMLQIAQERNGFAKKLFYSLVALIIFILIIAMVVYTYNPGNGMKNIV